MVSTRNSSKKKTPSDEEALNDDEGSGGNTTKSSERRRSRRKRYEELRSKSTGVVGSISILSGDFTDTGASSVTPNKKIVFGNDDDDDDDDDDETNNNKKVSHVNDDKPIADAEKDNHNNDDDDDDDDDDDSDAVEEVQSNVARLQAQKQRQEERTSAKESFKKTKKRKRKNRIQLGGEDAELDDEFFEKLDAERERERKNLRKKKKEGDEPEEPVGRHTTFVAQDEEDVAGKDATVETAHNIQVVVLKEPEPASSVNVFTTSEAAMVFSRSRMKDGSDVVSAKQMQKAKKAGKKSVDNTTWKRSKKMNRLLAPGAKKRSKGVAAAHFVVKM